MLPSLDGVEVLKQTNERCLLRTETLVPVASFDKRSYVPVVCFLNISK